jgi:hypothetical protein
MTKNIENMTRLSSYVIKSLLLTSGLLAAGIAVTIIFAPDAFYTGYGIDAGSNVSLANELKAPAGMLLIAGLLILAGVIRAELTVASLGTATVTFLSYGLSRLLSMAIDGVPHSGLVIAAMLEIAIGMICLMVFMRFRKSGFTLRIAGRGAWNVSSEEEVT